MTPGAIALTPVDLAVASGLVLVAGAVSVALRLGLLPQLLVASVRTVVQLTLIGFVLEWVFGLDSAPAVLGLIGLMGAAAGHAAVGRSSRGYAGALWRAVITLVIVGVVTTLAVTTLVVGVTPWYEAQYVIPLMGMVLGNALTGISLTLDSLLDTLTTRSDEIELRLSLGATRWEAARGAVAESVRRGMIPILNSMTVVGIVSLPGMMTGQILQGADPLDAITYQIVVMFMLCGATAMGAMAIAMWSYKRLFNARHQLLAERIRKR